MSLFIEVLGWPEGHCQLLTCQRRCRTHQATFPLFKIKVYYHNYITAVSLHFFSLSECYTRSYLPCLIQLNPLKKLWYMQIPLVYSFFIKIPYREMKMHTWGVKRPPSPCTQVIVLIHRSKCACPEEMYFDVKFDSRLIVKPIFILTKATVERLWKSFCCVSPPTWSVMNCSFAL